MEGMATSRWFGQQPRFSRCQPENAVVCSGAAQHIENIPVGILSAINGGTCVRNDARTDLVFVAPEARCVGGPDAYDAGDNRREVSQNPNESRCQYRWDAATIVYPEKIMAVGVYKS